MVGIFAAVLAVGGLICAWLEPPQNRLRPSWLAAIGLLVAEGILIGGAMGLGLVREFPLSAALFSVVAFALLWWKPSAKLGFIGIGAASMIPLITQDSVGKAIESTSAIANPLFFAIAVVGIAGACLAWSGQSEAGAIFTGSAMLVGFANTWTPADFGKIPSSAGTMLAIALVAAVLLKLFLDKGLKDREWLSGALTSLLLVVAGFALSRWSTQGHEMLPVIVFASVIAGLACVWMGAGNRTPFRTILGGLIWLGVATVAFSQGKSLYMAIAMLAGFGTLALLGQFRQFPLLGAALGLLGYRTFYADHDLLAKAYDIGQHYALIGTLLGAGAVMLAAFAGRGFRGRDSVRGWLRFGVTALLIGASLFPAFAMLGEKGSVGLIVGLGLGSLLAALDDAGGSAIIAFAALFGTISMAYGRLAESFDVSRDDKVKILLIAGIAIAGLIAILIFALSPKEPEEVAVEAA